MQLLNAFSPLGLFLLFLFTRNTFNPELSAFALLDKMIKKENVKYFHLLQTQREKTFAYKKPIKAGSHQTH